MARLYLIGIGPGTEDGVPAGAEKRMKELPALFAFKRYLPLTRGKGRLFGPKLDEGFDALERALEQGDAGLLVTGDPTAFSLLGRVKERFPAHEILLLPSCGARTALFAAFGLAADSPAELSGHGRVLSPDFYRGTVATSRQTLLYCDADRSPAWAARTLTEGGLGTVTLAVGSDLTWPTERLFFGRADELDLSGVTGHSVVLALNDAPRPRFWPGLPDESFKRGTLPMTKRDVRAAIVTALSPAEDDCLWDLGAGTGSVSVELALAAPKGTVYALEREEEGVGLIAANGAAFGAYNLRPLLGRAPEALADLPRPQGVFVGGSGGALEEILAHVAALGPDIRTVVSAVTLETAAQTGALMKKLGYVNRRAVTLSVTCWRLLGSSSLADARNPVTLWVGETGGREGAGE